MNTLKAADLLKKLKTQADETEFWIKQWESYRDINGMRNAALAIGKLEAIFSVLSDCYPFEESPPLEATNIHAHYQEKFHHLHLEHECEIELYAHRLDIAPDTPSGDVCVS